MKKIIADQRVRDIQNSIAHLRDRNDIILQSVQKIFGIWDGFLKTLGVLASLCISGAIIYFTRSLYYLDGKWNFGVIFFGAIVFIVITAGLIALVYILVNGLLSTNIDYSSRR